MAQNNQNNDREFQADYQYIKADVRKVVIYNLFFLAVLVSLYLANQRLGFLGKLENLL